MSESPASRVALSLVYCLTVMGLAEVPTRLLVKVPLYVPPLNQIVSPGSTEEGWFNAVCKSQGLDINPFPPAVPVVDAYHSAARVFVVPKMPLNKKKKVEIINDNLSFCVKLI